MKKDHTKQAWNTVITWAWRGVRPKKACVSPLQVDWVQLETETTLRERVSMFARALLRASSVRASGRCTRCTASKAPLPLCHPASSLCHNSCTCHLHNFHNSLSYSTPQLILGEENCREIIGS